MVDLLVVELQVHEFFVDIHSALESKSSLDEIEFVDTNSSRVDGSMQ